MEIAKVLPKGQVVMGKKKKTLYRVCNSEGEVLVNRKGQAVDGKGTHLPNLAQQKANEINSYYESLNKSDD